MAPFWSGVAIGIAIGLPVFLLCVLIGVALMVYRGIAMAIRSGDLSRSWREGRARNADIGKEWRTRMDARTQRLWESRERQLAWMQNHFGFRTLARLNRRICG